MSKVIFIFLEDVDFFSVLYKFQCSKCEPEFVTKE